MIINDENYPALMASMRATPFPYQRAFMESTAGADRLILRKQPDKPFFASGTLSVRSPGKVTLRQYGAALPKNRRQFLNRVRFVTPGGFREIAEITDIQMWFNPK